MVLPGQARVASKRALKLTAMAGSIAGKAAFCYDFQSIIRFGCLMSDLSLEAKKAYFARVRRKNYMASLRLEGFIVEDGVTKYKSREEAVLAHTRQAKTRA